MQAPESLDAWFAANVDGTGELLSYGTYVPVILDNGVEAYVLRTGVPNTWDGDPVTGSIYAISPTGNTVMAIFLSHDTLLPDGVSKDLVLDFLLNMLATVIAP